MEVEDLVEASFFVLKSCELTFYLDYLQATNSFSLVLLTFSILIRYMHHFDFFSCLLEANNTSTNFIFLCGLQVNLHLCDP